MRSDLKNELLKKREPMTTKQREKAYLARAVYRRFTYSKFSAKELGKAYKVHPDYIYQLMTKYKKGYYDEFYAEDEKYRPDDQDSLILDVVNGKVGDGIRDPTAKLEITTVHFSNFFQAVSELLPGSSSIDTVKSICEMIDKEWERHENSR